jgi:hypothetical protein
MKVDVHIEIKYFMTFVLVNGLDTLQLVILKELYQIYEILFVY